MGPQSVFLGLVEFNILPQAVVDLTSKVPYLEWDWGLGKETCGCPTTEAKQ